MFKHLFLAALLLFVPGNAFQAIAQSTRIEARELEWKTYAIPDAPFTRMVAPDKSFVLRVPADWKQQPDGRVATSPNGAVSLEIFIEKISDGMSLADYVGEIIKAVDNLPGATESPLVRKTKLQDLEAREILLQIPDPAGELNRTSLWITTRGRSAIGLKFLAPLDHISEHEPYFKAILQSINFIEGFQISSFEALRSTTIKDSKPESIRETQAIVSEIVEAGVASEQNITRLTVLFSQKPDVVVDLVEDRRPFVRMAAIAALARSGNTALTPFLWNAIDDTEPVIASYAAQSIATTSDVVTKLSEHTFGGFQTEAVARIWPYLSKQTRIQILQTIFSRPAAKPPGTGAKTKVSVSVTELTAVVPGQQPKDPPPPAISMDRDPSVQLGALALMRNVSLEDFKLPLPVILAANQDTLTVAALQVATERRESLPVDSLLKLASSSNSEIAVLAAANLGLSGDMSHLAKIQELIDQPKRALASVIPELKLSIEKIRFRDQLNSAAKNSVDAEVAQIKKGLSDPQLASFVWAYACDRLPARCGIKVPAQSERKQFEVQSYGENILPDKLMHFAAISNPGDAVQKFYQTFRDIQMDSARAQSTLVLIMGFFRQQAGQMLGAPNDTQPLIDYTGIKSDKPITVAAWIADGAPSTVQNARRQAMVIKVTNRSQFERFVSLYQRTFGTFGDLPFYIASVSRMMPALPAILPFSAKSILNRDPARPKSDRLMSFSAVGNIEWNGFQIKPIEYTFINGTGRIESNTTYVSYVGDSAIVGSDLGTVCELLARTATPDSERKTLSQNEHFRSLVQERVRQGGEVIYFSNLSDLGMVPATNIEALQKITESGQLRFSKSKWENTHQLKFAETDWSKPLSLFQPGDLSAPRLLLPDSTLAYLFVNLDTHDAWRRWSTTFLTDNAKFLKEPFALDLEKDVLDHLGPESGVALLEWPEFGSAKDLVWLAFFKLKNEKIKEALANGTLFRGVGPTTGSAQVKFGGQSYYVSVNKGFLLVSNQEKGLKAVETNNFLAKTRDYEKSVAKIPGQVVAFGGYNLAAAIALAKKDATDGLQSLEAEIILSLTQAFHSQSFFATTSADSINAQSSVSMDREGRFAVADLNYTRSSQITYVTVQPHGVTIADQQRLSDLVLRVKTKTAGALEAIKKDVAAEGQTVEQKSSEELLLRLSARKTTPEKQLLLPITDPQVSSYLVATPEIQSTSQQVIKQAREIAGNDKDAWSVARKLREWTHKNLEWRLTASADANQTLATREADCSEFSQLYVAMARSLGLPARIVSGLAYNGSAFGAHAWVEVWVGKWIELDPTYGTDFVDATHIRNVSNDLVTYAALNAIDVEVVETRRTIADFQRTPKALVDQLITTIPKGSNLILDAALNLELTVDEMMGEGEWKRLSANEREQLSSALRRATIEILVGYSPEPTKNEDEQNSKPAVPTLRLLGIEENGDRAEAICYYAPSDLLLKLRMVRNNGGWHLMEFSQADSDLRSISDALQPMIETIQARRLGRKPNSAIMTDFERALLLLDSNTKRAIEILDQAIKASPTSERLRLLKANALLKLEGDNFKAEALKLLKELVEQPKPYAPAVNRLARWYRFSEDQNEKKESLALFEKYLKLEPYDARAHAEIASAYWYIADNLAAAEAAYRKTIELDPVNTSSYVSLAEFFAMKGRLSEVIPLITAGEKYQSPNGDLFGSLMEDLYDGDELEVVKKLAARYPSKMARSARANIALANAHLDSDLPLQALRPLKLAAALDKQSPDAYVLMADAYRKLSRWSLALDAADKAIARDFEYAAAHYHRACALAKLKRTDEAMQALKRALELAPFYGKRIAEEKDLNSLASLAEFKKLIVVEKEP